jgi:uncharacterized lipoprotein YddW (UPF0748 family)
LLRLFYIFVAAALVTAFAMSQVTSGNVPIPKREVRAVWIATVMGLDWPKSFDPTEQQRSLREIVAKLKAANFNTIYFQVRGRADAMYRSHYEPWSQQLTGTLGEKPGWDPLQLIIDEAHAQGMELHAWFNTFLVKSGGPKPSDSNPQHVILSHPEWMHQVNGEWWFDPGFPQVRDYNLKVAMDLIRNYNVDGIQFDFIRYPGKPFPDDATYKKYGQNLTKSDWRRENVNMFVRAFHDSAIAIKPMLKIGATPIGIYTNFSGARGQQSYTELYQDSRRWLSEGKMDYIVPQVYWTLGSTPGDPDFAIIVKDWANNTYNKHVYIGIGVYKPEILSEVAQLIDTTRAAGLRGVSFFRYENISKVLDVGGRFQLPSEIPPMTWKDPIPPNPPLNVQVQNITDGIFAIKWTQPALASDGDGAKYFNIYRSAVKPIDVENPSCLIGRVSNQTTQYIDTINRVASAKYHYAITSIDKGNNESTPAVESVIIPEIVELAKRFSFEFSLAQNYPIPAASVVYIPYEISEKTPVFLKILDERNNELISVVDAVREPGRYIAAANISKLKDGMYTCLLVAGGLSQKRMFKVDN